MQPDGARLLTVADVANVLHLHSQTVRTMIRAGRLSAVRFGRAVRVPSTAIDAYLRPTAAMTAPALDTAWRNHPIFTGGRKTTHGRRQAADAGTTKTARCVG